MMLLQTKARHAIRQQIETVAQTFTTKDISHRQHLIVDAPAHGRKFHFFFYFFRHQTFV